MQKRIAKQVIIKEKDDLTSAIEFVELLAKPEYTVIEEMYKPKMSVLIG